MNPTRKNLAYEECPEIGISEHRKEEESTRKTRGILKIFFTVSFPFQGRMEDSSFLSQ
jgi:hypothetical protein